MVGVGILAYSSTWKTFIFFIICMMLAVGESYVVFIVWRYIPSMVKLLRFLFYHKSIVGPETVAQKLVGQR